MNTKYVIMLFYDIPNSSKQENKIYNKFRKYIISIGFVMIQESIYIKNINSKQSYHLLKRDLKIASPNNSNIRSMLITQRVYKNIDLISGTQSFNENIVSKKVRILEL